MHMVAIPSQATFCCKKLTGWAVMRHSVLLVNISAKIEFGGRIVVYVCIDGEGNRHHSKSVGGVARNKESHCIITPAKALPAILKNVPLWLLY
jgi:hypothetical protein